MSKACRVQAFKRPGILNPHTSLLGLVVVARSVKLAHALADTVLTGIKTGHNHLSPVFAVLHSIVASHLVFDRVVQRVIIAEMDVLAKGFRLALFA